MLPTKGYFQDIECPYYDNACTRPYCHFTHRRKPQQEPSSADETPQSAETPKEDVPVYKPTPKSQLAKSHIPISYVPDLAFRPERARNINRSIPKFNYEKPTYNPTPLSILSSANTDDFTKDNDQPPVSFEETKAIREIKLNIASVTYNPAEVAVKDDINFEELSAEFELIDDIIDDGVTGTADAKLMSSRKDISERTVKEPPVEEPVVAKEEVKSSEKKEARNSSKSKDVKSASSSSSSGSKDKSNKSSRSKDSSVSSKKSSKSDNHHSSSDEKSRHRSNSSSDEKTKKHKSKSSTKDKRDDGKKSSSTESSSKHHHHRSSSDKKSSSSGSSKENSHRHKERKKSKERDKHRKDDKKKKKPEEKKPEKKKIVDDDDTDGEDNNAEIVLPNVSFDSFDEDDEGDEDTMMECYKIFSEYQAPPRCEPEPDIRRSVEEDGTIEDTGIGKKRIAHGMTSEVSRPVFTKPKSQPSAAMMLNNRFKIARAAQASNEPIRIANALKRPPPPQTIVDQLPPQSKLPKFDSPAKVKSEVMAAAMVRRPTAAGIVPRKPNNNVIDSILNGAKNKPRKIAPVQNVFSIQREKAKIDEINRRKAAEVLKTPAQTQKGNRRVAHVPEVSLSDIPDVLCADKSKLPVNVRSRFLTMIADECFKLYASKEDAYNRALNDEFACYEKCKVVATYRNSAMLAVNRIRKEWQERERAGLGVLGPGEVSGNSSKQTGGKQFYDNIKKYVLTDEELDIHGYPKQSSVRGVACIKNKKPNRVHLEENQKKCSRCGRIYMVDDFGFVLYDQECIYHPLKKRTIRGEHIYLCCKSNDDTGCATSHTHVSEMSEEAELEGYQITMAPTDDDDSRNYAVYALDCEMCYTIKGLELTRVTVVDADCKTVYESLVKPMNPIIDYNTTFSGITKEQMDRTSTNILQVQANILHLCNSNTILIGHSLESDMKALKIIHGTIIDTAVMFPHKMGLPHKRALRALASDYLKKIIQNNIYGHDSAEDAVTCMELVKWKIKEELKVRR